MRSAGRNLWADRFDGAFDDIFDMQDRVAIAVAGVIGPTCRRPKRSTLAGRAPNDLGPRDLFLRADAMMNSSAASFPEALDLLSKAIERDLNHDPRCPWRVFAVCGWCRTGKARMAVPMV